MTYKDFELARLHYNGVEAIRVILTGDIQRKLKKTARQRKWKTFDVLRDDSLTVDLGGYTVTMFFKETKRLVD